MCIQQRTHYLGVPHPNPLRPAFAHVVASGHDGGRVNAVKHHSRRNRCACCPEGAEDDDEGRCEARPDAACECAFHAQASERLVERVCRAAAITLCPISRIVALTG